jgi:hypothetical protein
MGRLIAAVVILLLTLLGLRVVNSPSFRRNVALPFGTDNAAGQEQIPQPRSTGASSEIPPGQEVPPPVSDPNVTTPLPPTTAPTTHPGQLW